MSVPIYSVVAYSGTGKTTFLEKLIAELKSRGVRLGVVKHDAHHFEIDREGKDSWRFAQAGADVVAISSSEQSAFIEKRELSFDEVLSRVRDVDLILTEGYKTGPFPKIAVFRAESGKPLAGTPESFFAIVTDMVIQTQTPCFALDDAAGVASLILEDMKSLN